MKEDGTKDNGVEEEEEEKLKKMREDRTKDAKTEMPIQEAEDKEDCPICTDALPKLSHQFVRMTCCGKGLHTKCNDDLSSTKCMTLEQKNTCIMCRAKLANAFGSKEEIERLRKWAKKGKGWAMEMLANRYRKGIGVRQSDKKAIELYEMAAKRGSAAAQYNLGIFYDQGSHGLTQSDKRAFEFYALAAEQGFAEAQSNLAHMYITGTYVDKSDTRAIELFEMAAKGGSAAAQYNLGVHYEHGTCGLTQSSKRAIEFYTLAAEQGYAEAQFTLGCIYANGQGVERSDSKARKWWTKAAAKGHEQGIKYLKILEERLRSTTTTTPEVADPNIISCSTCGKPQTNEFKLKK